jgi:D-beta-D-heptose 7-phosphate kinase/D-beta-D-heptose 1-phosphate adenosyltransferase
MLNASHAMELLQELEQCRSPEILVVGDLILDRYVYGDAERLSPEAPVPVIRQRREHIQVGGAANVAVFLSALGARPVLSGICGADVQYRQLSELCRNAGVDTSAIVPLDDRPTSCKTRIVGLAQHRHQQQMLRLDDEVTDPVSDATIRRFEGLLLPLIDRAAVICIEDYNKGLLDHRLCQFIIGQARRAGKMVLVDPALIKDYSRYDKAHVVTPNRTEAELASGVRINSIDDEAPRLAAALIDAHGFDLCILTLDRHGMYLQRRGQPGSYHPTRPRQVYDVTGAGDMVLAMLAMAAASGISWEHAVDLGNVAGGLEVERFGSVPVSREEIICELQAVIGLDHDKMPSLDKLLAIVDAARRNGKKIVFTNGVFDVLHAGHVSYLTYARRQGDILIVGVNSDASVRALKGPSRPINNLDDRLLVLAGLEAVSYVVSFSEATPEALIKAITPDVLVKGSDYADKPVVGRQWVQDHGGQVVLAPFLPGRSSSATIERAAGLTSQ